MGLLGALALCLICLWAAGGNAQAAEQGEATGATEKKKVSYDAALRKYFKNRREYLGKSKHCYYTYAKNIYGNRKNGLVIVGLQESVKEIRIPQKIKGKKVIAIYLIPLSTISDDYRELLSLRAKSKTKSIVIPRYVDDISDDSIDQGHFLINLKKFKVSPKNRYFSSKSGVLFSKNGKILLNYPNKRKVSKYRIPKGVTHVSDKGFQDAYVGQVFMPDTVKVIDAGTFNYSHIKKISLPKNLSCIESYAFVGSDIQEIVIPGKVKEIPSFCFHSCKKLEKVTIKKGVKKIGKYAFVYCYNLRKVIIPSSVKKIEDPFSVDRLWFTETYDGIDYVAMNEEAWRNAGVTIYAKKASYAYRKISKSSWAETLGIKVKTM